MPRDSAGDHLRAKAAELERQFEEHKRRLADRSAVVVHRPDVDDDRGGGGGAGWQQEEEEEVVGRGRRYEAYVRRRDEKLRQDWRARMERKEAEVNALWARLDRGRRPYDGAAAATTAVPTREQKPLNFAKPMEYPATPRSSSVNAVKLPRLRSGGISSSPAAAAASPRLSNRQALHREPPPTPRKENRMPPATTPRPVKITLSRTRSSLKVDEEARGVRESPRPPPPPRVQTPRARLGGAGDRREAAVRLPAPPSADAVAVARSCFREQVVLGEIRVATAVASDSEPLHLRRTGNGVVGASPPPVIPGHPDVEANDLVIDERGNGDDAKITGDSDTEPSYVYIKRDNEEVGSGSRSSAEPKSGEEEETEIFEEAMTSPETDTTVSESPSVGAEAVASRESSESLYSNVQSSFSHGSELDASAAGSPLRSSPSSRGALSTEELLEADAAMLRKKREDDDDDDSAAGSPLRSPPSSRGALSTEELLEADAAMLRKKREDDDDSAAVEEANVVILPSTARGGVPVAGQSPIDAVAGLKRFLPFGKKNISKGATDEATGSVVVVERAPLPLTPPAEPRLGFSDAPSDDLDYSYVISPHVRSLKSFAPSSPATSELKEMVLLPPAKSPRVHRSFFSFSSFKNRGN